MITFLLDIKSLAARLFNQGFSARNLIRTFYKGPVKLIKPVKIAHSFLQSVSDWFHVIILSLPIKFYKWLSKHFSKPTSKNGDMCHFNLQSHF